MTSINKSIETKPKYIPKDKSIIEAIDERLEILEKEKEEIAKKYGLDDNYISSINNNETQIKFPSYINKQIPKTKKINYDSLTKLTSYKKPELTYEPYKTPENYAESLKDEPNLYELLDNENFKPSFYSINKTETAVSNPRTYDINDYLDKEINDNYFNDILH